MPNVININGFSSGTRSGNIVDRISRNIGIVTGTITLSASYTAGGDLIVGSTVLDSNGYKTGLDNFFYTASTSSPILAFIAHLPSGYTFSLVNTTKGSEKLKVAVAAGTEATGDLSSVASVPFIAIGYIRG